MRALNRSRIRDWRGSKIGKCPPNVRKDAPRPVRENDFPLAGRSFPRDQWIGRSATKFTIPLLADFERDLGQLLVYNEGQARVFLLTTMGWRTHFLSSAIIFFSTILAIFKRIFLKIERKNYNKFLLLYFSFVAFWRDLNSSSAESIKAKGTFSIGPIDPRGRERALKVILFNR